MLDLDDTLRELRRELQHVNRAIARIESIPPYPDPKRRGRKSMGNEERLEVSKRMKTYWANRHQERTA